MEQKEQYFDEKEIHTALEKMIPRLQEQIHLCLTLPNRSNYFWETEPVGEEPACLRRILLWVDRTKKGYTLIAEPEFSKATTVEVEPYVGRVCSGTLWDIQKKLSKPDAVDNLTHLFITLTKLSYGMYPFQRWNRAIKKKLQGIWTKVF